MAIGEVKTCTHPPIRCALLCEHEATTNVAPLAVEASPPIPTGRKPSPVRSTMDLPPEDHAAFLRWAIEASYVTGQSVRGQNVLRALARRIVADPDLQAQILDDLRKGRGQT